MTERTEPTPEPARSTPSAGGTQLPWHFQFTVAAVLILAFVVLTVFMLSWADASDGVWKNRVFVFSSVEAIVFTAVGWIFGREVHRAQAESARKDAQDAKETASRKADEAAEERAKGMRLAGAVESFAAGADADGRARDVGLDAEHEGPGGRSAQLATLHDLVQRLYGR
jgi:hypothetical protein